MSPTLNGSPALQCFKRGTVIEIRNQIMLDFYPRLPNMCKHSLFSVIFIYNTNWYLNVHVVSCCCLGDLNGVRLYTFLALAICNRKLQCLCTVNENMRLKSAGWEDSGVLIYTTSNHIKYALTNG